MMTNYNVHLAERKRLFYRLITASITRAGAVFKGGILFAKYQTLKTLSRRDTIDL